MSQPVQAAAGILFLLLVIILGAALIMRNTRAAKKAAPEEPAPEDPLAAAKRAYGEARAGLNIPHGAMVVSFAAWGALARHYCWLREGSLWLFPLWEAAAGEEQPLFRPWRIHIDSIVCYATQLGLPDKFTVLQYRDGDAVLSLAFSEDAARVFSLLLPEKDLSLLLEELYPKSSRNIKDIKESFLSLKELREGGLITEGEYAAKKKEMLISM